MCPDFSKLFLKKMWVIDRSRPVRNPLEAPEPKSTGILTISSPIPK
jgi:hypothetical protein